MIGSMMGLSAYWMHGMPFVFVLLAGTIGGGLVSVGIEFFIYRKLRLRRVSLINIMIATLGVSIVLQNVARLVWGSEPMRYPTLVCIQRPGLCRLHGLAAACLDRDPQRA